MLLLLLRCDLSSLRSVRDCANEINTKEGRIDVLINNAGVSFVPYSKTEDGLEIVISSNHFGHFLFTNLLLDKLKVSPNQSSEKSQIKSSNFDPSNHAPAQSTPQSNHNFSRDCNHNQILNQIPEIKLVNELL